MPSAVQANRSTKVEYTVLVDRSGTDTSKVACVGATVNAYLQGGTARSATGSGIAAAGSGTIQMSHFGSIEVGDVLQNGTASGVTGTVTAIARSSGFAWDVTVTAAGGTLNWAANDRFVNRSRRPTLYKDNGHQISWGGSSVTTDSNGRALFYAPAYAVDLIVSGGTPAVVTAVVQDVGATDTGTEINVKDFGGSIADALTYAHSFPSFVGPLVIKVPAGAYTYATADLNIAVNIGCRIVGEGSGVTYIQLESGNDNNDLFVVTAANVGIEGMTLYGTGASGTGRCIYAGSGGGNLQFFYARDLVIHNWSNAGIELGVSASSTGVDLVRIEQCRIDDSQSGACIIVNSGCTMVTVESSRVGSDTMPTGVYAFLIHPAANMRILNVDGNPADTSTYYLYGLPNNSFAHPDDGGTNLTIDGCDFEWTGAPGAATTPLIYVKGWSGVRITDTILYQMGSGIHLEQCYAPVVSNVVLKALGGSGYEIKFTDCYYPVEDHCIYEAIDGSATYGARRAVAVTLAGVYPGFSRYGGGLTVPTFLNDAERDTAAAAGADSKVAITTAGTLIYVVTPTAPTSHLQIRHGGAWVGVGSQAGAAI